MADIVIHFLSPFICFTLLTTALLYENPIFGLLSGLGFLSLAVNILINNIVDLSVLENTIIGSLYFGIGAYVFITAALESINQAEKGGA